MTSEDIKHQLIISYTSATTLISRAQELFESRGNRISEFRSCVKVKVAVLGSLSIIVLTVSVDVKQH